MSKITEDEALVLTRNAVENARTLVSTLGDISINNDESYTEANEILKHIAREKKTLLERKE